MQMISRRVRGAVSPRSCGGLRRQSETMRGVRECLRRVCRRQCNTLGHAWRDVVVAHPVSLSIDALWRAAFATRDRHARCRRSCSRRLTSTGSQRRPPLGRVESILQDLNLLLEEFDRHGLISDLGLEVVDEAVGVIGLANLAARLSSPEEFIAPPSEPRGQDAEFATERVERLASEDSKDDLGLASAGPAPFVGPPAQSFSRATPSLRIGQADAMRFVRGRHCLRDSQMCVSRNRAAHQIPGS